MTFRHQGRKHAKENGNHTSWAGAATVLRRLEVDLPALTSLADYALRNDSRSCADTDATAWNLPALKSIGQGNFLNFGIRGRLDLPAVETIGNSVLRECHFLTEVRLGAETKSVKSVGEDVLKAGDKGGDRAAGRLKKLVLGGVDGFTVSSGAFGGQPLEEVVFTGGVPAFAALLAGVEAAETKPVVVYASWRQGWDDLSYIDTDLTEAERAQAPAGATVLGVYRGGSERPLGKALVIHRASPYDPRGGAVIIR